MRPKLLSRKWGAALAALAVILLAGLARGQVDSGVYGAYTNNYGVFGYESSDGVTAEIDGYNGPGGAVAIPRTLADVVTIDNGIPEYGNLTVTSIGGGGAFSGCTNLTSVSIPNSVNTIGNNAFHDCTSLANVNIPNSVNIIGLAVFSGCTSLTSVNIPNSVQFIDNAAFSGCTNLTGINLGNGVTSIGEAAFYDCTSLTNVTIPDNVIFLGDDDDEYGVFGNCTSLASVTLGNSVTRIGSYAFASCDVTSVTIPASVTNIGDYAFETCYSLRSAYFLGDAPPDDGTVFLLDPATAYYLSNASGWGSTYGSVPAVLWNPQANTFSHTAGQFGFNLTGPANATIVVEACTNLSAPVWLPVATNTFSGLGTSTFSDAQSGAYSVRFYRIRSP